MEWSKPDTKCFPSSAEGSQKLDLKHPSTKSNANGSCRSKTVESADCRPKSATLFFQPKQLFFSPKLVDNSEASKHQIKRTKNLPEEDQREKERCNFGMPMVRVGKYPWFLLCLPWIISISQFYTNYSKNVLFFELFFKLKKIDGIYYEFF